jgi:hypothetical protein
MSDEIKPTPRGTLSGMLADALASVDSKLPRMASEIIGVPAMARTMDRVSYGEPLTTGRGMTLKPREDTLNALMGAAPFAQGAKAAAPLARKGAAMAVQNALAPTSPGMAQRGAIVYHGSPHTFDKFDMSKIGTGEGAQAYGHGLYFADNPSVAQSYQKANATWDTTINGAPLTTEHPQFGAAMSIAANGYAKALKQAEAAVSSPYIDKAYAQRNLADIQALKGAKITAAEAGALYKVDLPDEHIAKMLDWDKPLSQQSPEVQKIIAESDHPMVKYWAQKSKENPSYNGEDLHLRMSGGADRSKSAEELRKVGIPGIKYLDQGSRSAGDGTRNYVVFDHDLPKILERNGKSLADQLRDKLK